MKNVVKIFYCLCIPEILDQLTSSRCIFVLMGFLVVDISLMHLDIQCLHYISSTKQIHLVSFHQNQTFISITPFLNTFFNQKEYYRNEYLSLSLALLNAISQSNLVHIYTILYPFIRFLLSYHLEHPDTANSKVFSNIYGGVRVLL